VSHNAVCQLAPPSCQLAGDSTDAIRQVSPKARQHFAKDALRRAEKSISKALRAPNPADWQPIVARSYRRV